MRRMAEQQYSSPTFYEATAVNVLLVQICPYVAPLVLPWQLTECEPGFFVTSFLRPQAVGSVFRLESVLLKRACGHIHQEMQH